MIYLKWLLLFIPSLLIEIFCYLTVPFVCLFIRNETRTDRVKRLENKQVTMMREYLIKPFEYWSTHDNATDEYWWGMFNVDSSFKWMRELTQSDYTNSWFIRYVCRVFWLYRNVAYGFLYAWFSVPVEPVLNTYELGIEKQGFWLKLELFANSFKLEMQIPLGKRYFSMNIGHKAHKGIPRKLYANRIISFRRY